MRVIMIKKPTNVGKNLLSDQKCHFSKNNRSQEQRKELICAEHVLCQVGFVILLIVEIREQAQLPGVTWLVHGRVRFDPRSMSPQGPWTFLYSALISKNNHSCSNLLSFSPRF